MDCVVGKKYTVPGCIMSTISFGNWITLINKSIITKFTTSFFVIFRMSVTLDIANSKSKFPITPTMQMKLYTVLKITWVKTIIYLIDNLNSFHSQFGNVSDHFEKRFFFSAEKQSLVGLVRIEMHSDSESLNIIQKLSQNTHWMVEYFCT